MSILRFQLSVFFTAGFAFFVHAREPIEKHPIPNLADREKVEQRIKNLVKDDYAKLKISDRQALARKLLKLGSDTQDDLVARYVILKRASELAAKAGDALTAVDAIVRLSEQHEIDMLSELETALDTAAKSTNSRASSKEVSQLALALIRELVSEDHYDVACKVASLSKSSALKARDPELIKETGAVVPQLEDLRIEYENVAKGLDTLKNNADDPASNLAVGKFLCIVKDRWNTGLAMLLQCGNPDFQAVAEQEIAEPADPDKQAELGDGWWKLAETENKTIKALMQLRAMYWYKRAMPRLAGLNRLTTENKVKNAASFLSKTLVNAVVGEVRRFEGHKGGVWCIAISHDGRLAVSGGEDKTIRLWDLEGGRGLRRFDGHTDGVRCVTFLHSSGEILSGAGHDANADKLIRLWNAETGQEIRRFSGHTAPVLCVAISPDNRFAVSGSNDSSARLWELDTGREVRRFDGHKSLIYGVAFTQDGERLVTGSADKTIRVWDTSSGRELLHFGGNRVRSIAVSANGKLALAADLEGEHAVRLWDLERGRELFALRGHTDGVNSVAFAPDSALAISGSDDGTIRLWSLENGNEIHRFEGQTPPVSSVAFSPKGSHAVSGHNDGTVRLWRLPF